MDKRYGHLGRLKHFQLQTVLYFPLHSRDSISVCINLCVSDFRVIHITGWRRGNSVPFNASSHAGTRKRGITSWAVFEGVWKLLGLFEQQSSNKCCLWSCASASLSHCVLWDAAHVAFYHLRSQSSGFTNGRFQSLAPWSLNHQFSNLESFF